MSVDQDAAAQDAAAQDAAAQDAASRDAADPVDASRVDAGQPVLDRAEVAKVAKLAMLELSDADIDRFTGQLGAVLDRAKELQAFDISDVPPTAHPYPLVNVFRPDEVTQPADVRDEALAAAPEAEHGQFKVPPALGEEP